MKNKIERTKQPVVKWNNSVKIIVLVILIAAIVWMILANLAGNSKKIISEKNETVESTAFHFTKMGELTFLSKDGKYKTKIDIEIAETNESREQGLMYRDKMEENQGMLFIFSKEQMQSFWMKNTIIPLDIIYINANKEIVNIRKNTTPYSLESYPSTGPAKYVVEVNSGFTDKYKIKAGDKILWRRY